MADAVTTNVIHAGTRTYITHITNASDGTGESAVVKIDKSTLTGPGGSEPSKICIEKIEGTVNGMQVKLIWDHTSDVTIAVLDGGQVELDFTCGGGLRDPGTGGSGDVLLTTLGHTSGDSYDLILYCRLVA